MKVKWRGVLIGVMLMLAMTAEAVEKISLIDDGLVRTVVVLPTAPIESEALAAQELAEHIKKISGADIETVSIDAGEVDAFVSSSRKVGKIPILLGRTVLNSVESEIRAVSNLDGAFILRVRPGRIDVAGIGDGTLFGVYELLEQLGCRWFMPGELGTVIPSLKTVAVAQQETVQAPSFAGRYFQMRASKTWFRRMRCGGVPQFPSAHGFPGVGKKIFAQHPEYFGLIDGKRRPKQHCVSNPAVLQTVIDTVKQWAAKHPERPTIGIGPNDGGGFCECVECRALDSGDWDPFSNEASVTDRYIWFFNQVLAGIKDEYPELKIGFYIYHNYMRPPVNVKPAPNITGALAPISLCRIHGPRNPLCHEKQYYEWLAQGWGKAIPELWERGYWSNLACPGFPFVSVHRLRDQIPMCKDAGVQGWRVETFANWASCFPSFYIAAKLMWNSNADVDVLMADVAQKFFGPASEPMGQYIALMDGALRDADHHTGCSWDIPRLYPAPLRQEACHLLDEGAKRAAGKELYAARVQLITETFDLLEHFIAMMGARVQVDMVAAKRHLEDADAVAEKLMAYDPPMLEAGRFSTYTRYMRRFYRPCTEGGHKRVTGGNRLAAAFDDEWEFLIDPQRLGEELGWWRSERAGGNWQRIKTSSRSWSEQGLRYYKGQTWYRQTITIPEDFRGQRIFFWCGGVDEKARVWVNGTPIGISHKAAFYPFELDATAAVRPGEPNIVVVSVVNDVVNEIGTGGIVAPAFFYAPKDGAEAELDNSHPLQRTFP